MPQIRMCPICNRPLGEHEDALRFRPFCSKRCADIDLGRWLKESYRVPTDEGPAEEEPGAPGSSGQDR